MTGQATTSTTSTISPLSGAIKNSPMVVLEPLWLRNTQISELRYTLRIEVEGGERWAPKFQFSSAFVAELGSFPIVKLSIWAFHFCCPRNVLSLLLS